jgi:Flp pilus assembly protein TadD
VRPGTEYEHEDFRRLASRQLGRELTLAEASSYWMEQAVDYIRRHPLPWLRLELRKLVLFWHPREIPDNRNFHFFKRYSAVLRFPLVNFAVLAPLALAGMVVALGTWRRSFLLYLQVLLSMLSVLLFFVSSRYRLPTVPFLILFAAYGLRWFGGMLRARRWLPAMAMAIPTAAFLLVTGYQARGLDEAPFAARQETLGVALIRDGRVEEGIARLEEVTRLDPDRVPARFNLGVAYLEEMNRPDRAAREFRKVIRLQKGYPQAHYMLARAYYGMDRIDEALEELKRELQYGPGDDVLRLEFEAMVLVNAEQWAEAEAIFRRIIGLRPASIGAHRSLGNVLLLQGRKKEAIASWERALELDPSDGDLRGNLTRLRSSAEAETAHGEGPGD